MKTLKESEAGTSEISYYELASKLKAAYRAKAKNQDDMYAEVNVHCYCGGPFEMSITCSGLDDMPNGVAFYVTYLAEDDFGFDVGFGMNNLKTTISDYYKANGDPTEMSPKIAIDPSALRFLDEIAAGQGMLFEKKVNEAVEQYVHPTLRKYPDIQDGIFYTCYTLDVNGDEEEPFADFDNFLDAISACRQKTDDTHQATHACIVARDKHDPDSKDFLNSYGLISYEVVAEFSPDAGEALTEGVKY